MKKHFLLLLLAILILAVSCKHAEISQPVSSFREVSKLFYNPPAYFRTVPFWVWNDSITREKIETQLADYKEMGFGGVFVHPRYGLITEYLSKDWFDLFSYAVEKGKQLGISVWIYDENSFHSGFAGGHVPAEMPESYNHGQVLTLSRMSLLKPDTAKKYLHIFRKQKGGFEDITTLAGKFKGMPGDFWLMDLSNYPRSKWFGGFSYVDLLYPGVTQKFIDITMKGYEASVGEELGKTVPGIFTDEPNISAGGGSAVRWTPDLYARFREKWGYDLVPNLPSLFAEEGDFQKVRHDYYALLLELFINRWSKPWSAYTESKRMKWTGHYWEHAWPDPEEGPDNMAMYAYPQQPAIDLLFNTMKENGKNVQFGNVRAVKELASVANQLDKPRTLSETYGASGWELRFVDMKRYGDWEYALGVNLMNQHLSFMTLVGDRKYDFPQSFSYHEPWWRLYKQQTDYFGRLSLALTAGKQVNKLLVLEPTTSAWMYFSPIMKNKIYDLIDSTFPAFLDQMERHQLEYDLGCEDIIRASGRVEPGKFIIGKRDYATVIIPPGMENLEASTMKLLDQFLAKGGTVICMEEHISRINGQHVNELAGVFRKYKGWKTVRQPTDSLYSELLSGQDFAYSGPVSSNGLLFHQRRVLDDGQMLFFVNSSMKDVSRGSCKMKGVAVARLDPETGQVCKYPSAKSKGDTLNITFSLPPAGSLLLFISDQELKLKEMEPEYNTSKEISPSKPMTVSADKPNVMVLDYCTLSLSGKPDFTGYFYSVANKIWQQNGFPENPWVSSTQYRRNILDRDTFGSGTGFKASFIFNVGEGVDLQALQAVVERPWLWKVKLNDDLLTPEEGNWWLDRDFGVFSLKQFIRRGLNTLSVESYPMRIHAELEPVYILGNFRLDPSAKGWEMNRAAPLSTGSWKAQGWPFYPFKVTYGNKYHIEAALRARYKLSLGDWKGAVAEVIVNGKSIGIIYRKPYELDISDDLHPGDNDIAVSVYGSLKNLLGPFHNGRENGIVTPWSFKYAPDLQPAGAAYDLLDYGLMENFKLIMLKP